MALFNITCNKSHVDETHTDKSCKNHAGTSSPSHTHTQQKPTLRNIHVCMKYFIHAQNNL